MSKMLFVFSEPICIFIPPKDWEWTNPKYLSNCIIAGFVGPSKSTIRPSINLAKEECSISLEEYVKAAKKLHNEDNQMSIRDLKSFSSNNQKVHLLELTKTTQFGKIKMLQAITIKEKNAYILTAAASGSDFLEIYKELIMSIKSIFFTEDLISSITDEIKRKKIIKLIENLHNSKNSKKDFNNFQNTILKDYKNLGLLWQTYILKQEKIKCDKSKILRK